MRKEINQELEMPEGISCEYTLGSLSCKGNGLEVKRAMKIPGVNVIIHNTKITLHCKKGNKNDYKTIMSNLAHIRNIFNGLNKKYIYHLDICNVHFPMTVKIDKNKFMINNFLGEKTPRTAKIIKGVEVEVKGQKITVQSPDLEAAGQTAANIEKATQIRKRDRRIFQDGIYITEKQKGARRR